MVGGEKQSVPTIASPLLEGGHGASALLPPLRSGGSKKRNPRIVIRPPLQLLETLGRRERRRLRLLHHQQRTRRQPAAIAQRGQRLLRESFAIGRIEERQRERLHRMRRAEIGGIAAIDLCHAAKTERLD